MLFNTLSCDQLPNEDLSFKPFKSHMTCNLENELLLVDQKCIFFFNHQFNFLALKFLALLLRTPALNILTPSTNHEVLVSAPGSLFTLDKSQDVIQCIIVLTAIAYLVNWLSYILILCRWVLRLLWLDHSIYLSDNVAVNVKSQVYGVIRLWGLPFAGKMTLSWAVVRS
jgi:hypothetical protein